MGFISRFKIFFIYITVVLTVIFGVTIVFGSNLVFETPITAQKLSNNVFVDSAKLKNNLVIFNSSQDLSSYTLETSCDLYTKYEGKKNNDYYFSVKYSSNCLNPNLYLKSDGHIISGTHIKFNVHSKADLFNLFSDLSTDILEDFISNMEEKQKNYNNSIKSDSDLDSLKNKRLYEEGEYTLSIVKNIVNSRKEKYIVPVAGYKLPTLYSKVPNSSRNYRKNYTDGIHHGWDIDTKYGEDVIALDSGLIVRVVSGFEFTDLSNINYVNLDQKNMLKNLDILRGNQVWLKTNSGDIVFYSHLSSIDAGIQEGDFVHKGQILGKVGITGIPDRNYTNYHLHFVIHKNPYITSKAGKYSFEDYMSWDWYFKGQSIDEVIKNQGSIFK